MAKQHAQGKDPEMETLKKRVAELEQALSAKSEDYNKLAEGAKLIDEKLKKSEEANKNLSEEAERLKLELADAMNAMPVRKGTMKELTEEIAREELYVPPKVRAELIIAAIGSIKDRQNDAPLDKKNFEHMVDPFIEQAEYIADKVIERVLCQSKTEE